MSRSWIAVACAEHVRRGVALGIAACWTALQRE